MHLAPEARGECISRQRRGANLSRRPKARAHVNSRLRRAALAKRAAAVHDTWSAQRRALGAPACPA
jgi:hypothetical protein